MGTSAAGQCSADAVSPSAGRACSFTGAGVFMKLYCKNCQDTFLNDVIYFFKPQRKKRVYLLCSSFGHQKRLASPCKFKADFFFNSMFTFIK